MAQHGADLYLKGISDVSLRQLECFVAVADERRFVGAAKRLRMSQPPVSRLIHRLERTTGKLFVRTAHGVELTPVGHAILGPVRRALAEVGRATEAARAAAEGQTGAITVGFSSSAAFSVLPGIIRRYRATHPDVELSLRELVTAEQLRDLEAGLLDVAVARGPISSAGLTASLVHREPFVAVLPVAHALAHHRHVALADLLRERFVFIPRHVAPAFYDSILQACRRAGATPVVREQAAEWHTIVSLVGAGLGVSIAPASLQRLEGEAVAFRPLKGARITADLFMACRSDDESPLVRAFVELAAQERQPGGRRGARAARAGGGRAGAASLPRSFGTSDPGRAPFDRNC